MGDSTGGYEEARGAIEQGMQEQRGLEQGGEAAFGPYQQAGAGGLDAFRQALAQGQDPSAFINQLMGQYQQSPGYEQQLQAGEQAANRASAASGMLGSGAEQQAAAGRAQGLRSQDVQNYLNNVLGLRQQYLGGQSGLAGMGLKSAEDIMGARQTLGGQLGQGYGGIGQTYIGEAQQPGFFDQLLGTAGTLGGAFLGGPGGAALGGALGKGLGGMFGGGGGGAGGGVAPPIY